MTKLLVSVSSGQMSLSKKAVEPSVAQAKKVLQRHEKEKHKQRVGKAKTYKSQYDKLNDKIAKLEDQKKKAVKEIADKKKALTAESTHIAADFDSKIKDVQKIIDGLREKAQKLLNK